MNFKNPLQMVLDKKPLTPPPIWLMRQAGRYLPEYRAIRQKIGSFWTMCMTPALAAEITLQPVQRFDFDAAIAFSDILVVPYALGQKARFEDDVGPILEVFPRVQALMRDVRQWEERLTPVYEALTQARARLSRSKMLLGFAGGAWTLAAYMLEGRGSSDQRIAKLYAYQSKQDFAALLDILCEAVAWHLGRQVDAGADAVQIFESWAGGLAEPSFEEWVIAPTKRIVDRLRTQHPKVPVIGFPRGATQTGYERYAAKTGVDAVSLDTAVPLNWAIPALSDKVVLQGNLDPIALVAGGAALDAAVDGILAAMRGHAFVFNLGHGVLPETPLAHVERLVARVRGHA